MIARTAYAHCSMLATFVLATFALAACGGGGSVRAGLPPASNAVALPETQRTFSYTGKPQSFVVPANVTTLTVNVLGARGAGQSGGFGGRVRATISVTPHETLRIYVGGQGSASNGYGGGFNGGAAGGAGLSGDGGGGASDIRMGGDKLFDRIIVAGGGGGQGGGGQTGSSGGKGGIGGNSIGGSGAWGGSYASGGGGGGGRQDKGGHGGSAGNNGLSGQPGRPGSLGGGGRGGAGAGYHSGLAGGGGGGGGGYYGGGGGGGGGSDSFVGGSGGGGGGGSSYVAPSVISHREWRGWRNATGNGVVVISWR